MQDRELNGEARWQTIGMVPGVHVVAHTVDEEAEVVRILPLARRHGGNGASMRKVSRTKKKSRNGLTAKQKRELAAAMTNDAIDTSDIPELPLAAWKEAVRGRFYRPVKRAVSLRLDADGIAWLKKPGKGYQTRANQILRRRMIEDLRA